MRKFKKGDKIYRPRIPEITFQVDDIQEIHFHYVCTSSKGERTYVPFFCENQWELVEKTDSKHKFKVGDMVVLVNNPHAIHTITEVNEKDGEYYLESGCRGTIPFEYEPLWVTVDESELEPAPELIKRYEDLANDYLSEFVKQTGIEDDTPFWVGDDIGGVACIADYYVNYETIRFVVDNHINFERFDEWYTYCNEVGMIDSSLPVPTLKQWAYNEFKLISHERLEELKNLKLRFEQLIDDEKQKQDKK